MRCFLLAALIFMSASTAFAQEEVYVWKDDSGNAQSSESAPSGWKDKKGQQDTHYEAAEFTPIEDSKKIEKYLKMSFDVLFKTLRDPRSFQFVSGLTSTDGTLVKVFMEYRAKNGFGGYKICYSLFKFDEEDNLVEENHW